MTPHEDGEFLDRLWGSDYVSVNPVTGCWEHINAAVVSGYVQLWYKGKVYYGHRVALELKLGRPIAEGLFSCHSCDVRHCVNPAHLNEWTQRENVEDMVAKGRHVVPLGERHGQAWLSDDDVLQIKRLLVGGMHTQKEIGEMFGVEQPNISRINSGGIWTHVPWPFSRRGL